MRSPPLLWYFPHYQHTTVVCGGGGLNKYQTLAPDTGERGACVVCATPCCSPVQVKRSVGHQGCGRQPQEGPFPGQKTLPPWEGVVSRWGAPPDAGGAPPARAGFLRRGRRAATPRGGRRRGGARAWP